MRALFAFDINVGGMLGAALLWFVVIALGVLALAGLIVGIVLAVVLPRRRQDDRRDRPEQQRHLEDLDR